MSNLTLFIASLLVAIAGVTYALMRLAPTTAPLPRGFVDVVHLLRGIYRHRYALGILIASAFGGWSLYWAITAYPIATSVAAISAISGVIALLVVRLNK